MVLGMNRIELKEITDEDIIKLRDNAAVAGDRAMVVICRIALGETSEDVGEDMSLDEAEDAIVCRYESRAAARDECERVIRENAAQEDS